ncbi:hypothetical protein [Asticcacaulis sp. W401b]|uniref:hypothetical protein n=1 Tax=Asticcacaulis sp. W401b TaxID=3388666 RepID=UPI003970E0A0
MRKRGRWILAVVLALWPATVCASAWGPDSGASEVIVKVEVVTASQGFDASGTAAIDLPQWEEKRVTVFAERGVHDLLSVFAKANIQDIQTSVDSFSGLGSVEIGLKTPLYRSDRSALSASVSLDGFGKGRRDEFSVPGDEDPDVEVRLYGGHSFEARKVPMFVDAQVARRARSGSNADQWRVDVTVGARPSPKWIVMAQVFAGKTDRLNGFEAKWTHVETSAVRFFDAKQTLGVQFGLRQTVSGENVPKSSAVTIGLWKRF